METIDLIERVTTRLGPPAPGEEGEHDYPIEAQVPGALETLARLQAEGESRLLTKTFTVTCAAGEGPMATLTSAAEPILLDFIDQAIFRIAGYSFPLRMAPDRSWLAFDPSSVPSWAIEGNTLYVKDNKGKVGTYAGDVLIQNAHYISTLANLPRSLEGKLVDLVVAMVISKIPKLRKPAAERTAAPAT